MGIAPYSISLDFLTCLTTHAAYDHTTTGLGLHVHLFPHGLVHLPFSAAQLQQNVFGETWIAVPQTVFGEAWTDVPTDCNLGSSP